MKIKNLGREEVEKPFLRRKRLFKNVKKALSKNSVLVIKMGVCALAIDGFKNERRFTPFKKI